MCNQIFVDLWPSQSFWLQVQIEILIFLIHFVILCYFSFVCESKKETKNIVTWWTRQLFRRWLILDFRMLIGNLLLYKRFLINHNSFLHNSSGCKTDLSKLNPIFNSKFQYNSFYLHLFRFMSYHTPHF